MLGNVNSDYNLLFFKSLVVKKKKREGDENYVSFSLLVMLHA